MSIAHDTRTISEPMPDLKNIEALRRPVVQVIAALACAVAATVVVLDLVMAALSIFSAPNWSVRVLILIGSPALLVGGFTVFYSRIRSWVNDGETGDVSE